MALPPAAPDDLSPMATINTTPLVDVMLVLLIIFLITVPVVSSSVAVRLPQESAPPADATPVLVSVDAQGRLYWFDTPLPDAQALLPLLGRVAAMQPQPEVHIRADARARYEAIGRVVAASEMLGIARVGFVTEPARSGSETWR